MQNFNLTTSKIHEFTEYLGETSGESFMKIVRDLIRLDPFSGHKFYIFSFIKLQNKERFHQPRLTKPEPLPGTTLVRVDPKNPDMMTVCWTLPGQEAFNLYKHRKIFSEQFVYECIETYLKNPRHLMKKEKDDVSDEDAKRLYTEFRKKIAAMDRSQKERAEELKSALERLNSSCVGASKETD